MPSSSLNIAACVPFSGTSAHARFRSEAWSPAAARATSLTTLLTTLVSLDPLYLDFDMSESDFLTFPRERARIKGPLANKILIGLSDEDSLAREGTLDFIDNALDRSSGTIHARATVPNRTCSLAPGQFARLRVASAPLAQVYLLPDAAVVLDQSERLVMTIGLRCHREAEDRDHRRPARRLARDPVGSGGGRPRRHRRPGARHQSSAAGRHHPLQPECRPRLK
jgi:hypothetical protein